MTRLPQTSRGAIHAHCEWMRLRGLAQVTIVQRRQILRRLEVRTGKAALSLRAPDLDAYQRRLSANPATRGMEISHLRGFYRWAVQAGELRADPASVLIQPKRPKRVPRPMSEADVLVAITQAPDRIRPWLVLAAFAGLRACEVAALDRSDVLEKDDPPHLILRGKGSKERVVVLNRTAHDALLEHGLPARGPVFRRCDGQYGPNKPHTISNVANEYLRSVGVDATFHQLRHRFASQLYQRSLDIRLVQSALGHANLATTAGYAAYATGKAAESMRLLDSTG